MGGKVILVAGTHDGADFGAAATATIINKVISPGIDEIICKTIS